MRTNPTSCPRAIFGVLLILIAAISNCGDAYAEDPAIGSFLSRLIGSWAGRAEKTPAGPRPYNMTFAKLADGRIAAAASPGNATHHWWFSSANDRLHLTFLTTFQGNRDSQQFLPATIADQEAVFATKRADRLTVRFRFNGQLLDIDVLRHDRLHVAIRLVKVK